jgi:hypothetical protein
MNIEDLRFAFGGSIILTRQLNSSFPAKGFGIFDRPQRSGEPESRKGLAIAGFPP